MTVRNLFRGVLLAVALLLPSASLAAPVERSFEEFLAAQGTFCLPDPQTGGCLLLNPPLPNVLVWTDTDDNLCAYVDYAGTASRYLREASGGAIALPTSVAGTVTEEANENGTADLTITLSADNALVWVVEGCSLASGPVLFGRNATEVLQGATPTLGSARMRVRLQMQAPGMPLPDLFQILASPHPAQTFIDSTFSAHASGELRDVSDPAEGHLNVLHKTVWRTGSSYLWPVVAELIIIR